MKESPSYYAVIPSNVRYSKSVSNGAKLLFGEITCLCNTKGYCWATNTYFAELYTASNRTISRWISELAAAGFISMLVDDAKANSRKIWLVQPVIDTTKMFTPIDKNVYTQRQKRRDPIDKNVYHNNKENNKENKGATDVEKIPSPENKLSTVEAFLPLNKEGSAAGPRHSDKPQNLETHTDLVKQIGEYYKANPREWIDSVKAMSGPMYSNEQLKGMLVDYCSHCFSSRNPYQKFSQHNGDFCRWVKNQKQFERTPPATPEKQADVTRFYNQIPVTK